MVFAAAYYDSANTNVNYQKFTLTAGDPISSLNGSAYIRIGGDDLYSANKACNCTMSFVEFFYDTYVDDDHTIKYLMTKRLGILLTQLLSSPYSLLESIFTFELYPKPSSVNEITIYRKNQSATTSDDGSLSVIGITFMI